MVAGLVFEAEFDLAGHHIDDFNRLGGGEADNGAFAPFQAADGGLHKGTQVTGSAVLHIEHDADVAVVLNRHSFSHVIRGCHN